MIWITLISLVLVVVMSYYNWTTNRNSIYLGVYLALFSLYALTHYLLVIDYEPFYFAILFNHITPFYLILGPLLFWYTRGIIKDEYVFKPIDLLHLIPALIQFIAIFEYSFLIPFSEKVAMVEQIKNNPEMALAFKFNSFFSTSFNVFVRIASLVLYALYSFFLLVRYIRSNRIRAVNQLKNSLTLRWVIYLHLSSALLVTFYYLFVSKFSSDIEFLDSGLAGSIQTTIGILTSLNSFSLILFPELLYGIPRRRVLVQETNGKSTRPARPKITAVGETPYKDSEYFFELALELERFMKEKKPYLNQDCDLNFVSLNLKIPQHHISLCLKIHYAENFSSFRNRYRIEYAKTLLADQALKNRTIDAIAEQAGFKSRTSFYNAFERIEGQTPTSFTLKS